MNKTRIHGPRVVPPNAMPDSIMAWYRAHPEAAKGLDLDKLRQDLQAWLDEGLRNGTLKLADDPHAKV
jgi:hypothetical protein